MNAVPVIALDHPVAHDAARVGDDAAALAAARAAGLPVGPGVVLTPEWRLTDSATTELLWKIVSHDGAMQLAVRPSPIGSSSLEPPQITHSAASLLAAARRARSQRGPDVAVLIQPVLPDDWRGVLVADDSGSTGPRRRHLIHAATPGGDWIGELDVAGRVRGVLAGEQRDNPPVEVLARLARLAGRLTAVLGTATDFEFAVDGGHVRALHLRGNGTMASLNEYQFETAA